uniref:Uncharacterized protein n=1 Tax=Setaria viridis TaxID=4556 RepID=A0A4U6VAW4_SETVI|nr:hypothetical protein SEVIR_3G139150v2 [Setaria viridis]
MAVWAILAALATSFVHLLLVQLRNSDTGDLAYQLSCRLTVWKAWIQVFF